MANLGALGIVHTGRISGETFAGAFDVANAARIRRGILCAPLSGLKPAGQTVVINKESYSSGFIRDNTIGNPTPPSLQIQGNYYKKTYSWPVSAGVQTISIDVKRNVAVPNYAPSLTVRTNAALGINADVVAEASATTEWTTIGPISLPTTVDGVITVDFEVPYPGKYNGQIVTTYVDNFKSNTMTDKFLSWQNGVPVFSIGTSAIYNLTTSSSRYAWGTPVFSAGPPPIP
jgi:hypothetical protein